MRGEERALHELFEQRVRRPLQIASVHLKSCGIVAERSSARRSHASSTVPRGAAETKVFLMQCAEMGADTCAINVATSWLRSAS